MSDNKEKEGITATDVLTTLGWWAGTALIAHPKVPRPLKVGPMAVYAAGFLYPVTTELKEKITAEIKKWRLTEESDGTISSLNEQTEL